MRRLLVAGNWKMHGSHKMAVELISGVIDRTSQMSGDSSLAYDILVCPPAPYLGLAVSTADGSSVNVGAQNVSPYEEGAYTGEISLRMLREIACRYVLLGHSERRNLFGENDQMIARKFAACAVENDAQGDQTKVTPILCIGELLADRQAGNTEKVVSRQIDAVLDKVGIGGFKNAVIAYEPVWAIGTGETASPEQAQDVHAFIRSKLAELDADIASNLQILYGGSVKPSNAEALFAQADIDGGLIGGASLSVDNFSGICEAAQKLSDN